MRVKDQKGSDIHRINLESLTLVFCIERPVHPKIYDDDYPVLKHKETDKEKPEKSSTGGLSQTLCHDSDCKEYS